MTCKDCRHYKTTPIEHFPPTMTLDQIEVERRKGLCTAHPPVATAVLIPQMGGVVGAKGNNSMNLQIQGITFWPTVWEHETCGEWSEGVKVASNAEIGKDTQGLKLV